MDYEKKYNEALEKARQLCAYPTTKPFINDLQNLFPELKDSEDETIRKRLIEYFKDFRLGTFAYLEPKKIIAWLEKQGESDETKAKMFLIDKGYPIDANGIFPTYEEMYNIIREGLENQGEQNLANFAKTCKVEPKFKVGDWVVTDKCDTVQIGAVNNGYYTLYNGMIFNVSYVDKCWHLWSIADAKDGDVLATEDWVFIFKKMNSNGKPVCYCHYDIELGFRIDTNSYMASGSEIYPATKEQREQLEKAIADAGYVWLSGEKELKKIEQKPAKNIVETWKEMRLEVYQQASGNRHEPNYSDDTTKMFSLNDIDEIIEKMSEL